MPTATAKKSAATPTKTTANAKGKAKTKSKKARAVAAKILASGDDKAIARARNGDFGKEVAKIVGERAPSSDDKRAPAKKSWRKRLGSDEESKPKKDGKKPAEAGGPAAAKDPTTVKPTGKKSTKPAAGTAKTSGAPTKTAKPATPTRAGGGGVPRPTQPAPRVAKGGEPGSLPELEHHFDSWKVAGDCALEASRLVPMVGILTGLAADARSTVDLTETAKTAGDDRTLAFVAVRQTFGITANILSGVEQNLNLLELMTTAGGVTAVALPFLGAFAEALSSVGIAFDLVVTLLDVGTLVSAQLAKGDVKKGSDEFAALEKLERTFAVNLLGDAGSLFLDAISIASAGLSQSEAVENVSKVIKTAAKAVDGFDETAVKVMKEVLSRTAGLAISVDTAVGGEALESTAAPRKAEDLQAARSGQAKLHSVHKGYNVGSSVLDSLEHFIGERVGEIEAAFKVVAGEKDPARWFADQAATALEDLGERATRLGEANAQTGLALETVLAADEHVTHAQASLDSMVAPQLPTPKAADLGDSVVGDMAEATLNGGLELALEGLRILQQKLDDGVDAAKVEAGTQLQAMKDETAETTVFLDDFKELLGKQIEHVAEISTELSTKLEGCGDVEAIFDALLSQLGEVLGFEGFASLDDLRGIWQRLGDRLGHTQDQLDDAEAEAEAEVVEGSDAPSDEA